MKKREVNDTARVVRVHTSFDAGAARYEAVFEEVVQSTYNTVGDGL